jgi:hypothetical protein
MWENKRRMTPQDARADHWRMLRFMAMNAAIGMGLGLAVTALIILFDLGGIGSHIARAADPILPIILIAFPMALVFGAAVTASAIWLMPYESKYAPEPREEDDHQEDPDRKPW